MTFGSKRSKAGSILESVIGITRPRVGTFVDKRVYQRSVCMPPLPNMGSRGYMRIGFQRLLSDAMTSPASASSTQGVTVNTSTSDH
jgi:hypothetical protein